MATIREAVRQVLFYTDDLPKRLGFAWALNFSTLFKFMSFRAGEQRERVADVIQNSRIYCPTPDLFNDPYDVSPVIRHGGDPTDPQYIAELDRHERLMLERSGKSPGEIEAYRAANGVDVMRLADEARDDLRRKIRGDTRILCLTAEQCHPLQWSHYADKHKGLCLHFRCRSGTKLGLAREVRYAPDRQAILIPLDRQSHDEVFDRLVMAKADFWSYEKEFRIIAHNPDLQGPFLPLESDDLIGVTMGMCMPEEDRVALLAMVDQHRPGLPIWAAVEDYDRFWMKIERVR